MPRPENLPENFPTLSPGLSTLPRPPQDTNDTQMWIGYLHGCFEAVNGNMHIIHAQQLAINGTGRKNETRIGAIETRCAERGKACGKIAVSVRGAFAIGFGLLLFGAALALTHPGLLDALVHAVRK